MLLRNLLSLAFLCGIFCAQAQSTDTEKREITKLTDIADNYLVELKFKESLQYSREALKRAVAIDDAYLIATAYNTIAGNYDELSEPDKAINYYNKGLEYANKTQNDSLKNWLNNNLGNMYCFEKKQYEKGLFYYDRSLYFSERIKDTAQMVFTKLNMGWAYFDIGQFEKGEPYLEYVNQHFDKFGRKSLDAARLLLNAMLLSHKNKDEKAAEYFRKAMSTAAKTGEILDLSYSYQEYSKFLYKKNDYRNAYKYLDLYGQIKDSIYNQDKLQVAANEGQNLELDEYKRAVQRIEAEKEIQSLSLKKSQIIVILFVITLLALLLLTYLLYKNNLFRKQKNAELLLTNEELRIAKEKAEEAARLKTQFVSTISHELRTPLYGVVGITNMISDEHKELKNSPHLNSLKFSAKYLLSLVNDILQINKIEEKRVVLEHLTFNLSDELATIRDSLQFIATKNRNTLILETDPEIPEFLIGDKLRLSQIFMNLVSNALKFTQNGEVHISAKQEKIEGNMHFIHFSISDNGIGIAKEDQDKIFEKFVQIERKESDYQGTGLGLSIVKKLIELFGSEIQLESAEGAGTTFSFTIPLEHNPEKANEIVNNIEVDLTSGQIFNVLVVEDNKINQMVTKKILENHSFKCQIVDDGIAALAMLQKKNKYDLILMDINMPVINGFETTRRIRAMGIETPIVALTAYDKGEITEEAISAGMNDIIIKPFEPVKLFQVIMGQINKKEN
ncbi:ATP-binding response regulator [Flavobacterium silvaticum]|uniref:histidine kinase n=1 Tax=Flavobacterium silvaticum TaxID=1852020 RepID=A0A972FV43_9FLAO|nr:ATP-binding protein [Flavobacterium silvaticum]NMH29093.1 response regulator [Flavobacterium silvaticum]